MVIRTWCEELRGLNYLEDLDFYELISVAMPEPWCVDVPLDRNVSAGNRDWRAVNVLNYHTLRLIVDGTKTLGYFWKSDP